MTQKPTSFLSKICVVLLSLFGLSCKPTVPKATLILFEASWCKPCMALKQELKAAGIQDTWSLQIVDGCSYALPVVHVDESQANVPEKRFKSTDAFPEQAFLWQGQVRDHENWSNKASLESWLQLNLTWLSVRDEEICPTSGWERFKKKFK